MNKSLKSIIAIAVISFVGAGFSFAAPADAPKTENKVAGCCAKAKADNKTCTHACCVEAAKDGKNCAKCGGSGMVQKTEATDSTGKKKKGKKKADSN